MRFELLSYDEYGQSSIVASANNIEAVLSASTKFINSANVDNALAASEREKAWEAYMPVLVKRNKVRDDMIYAGNKRTGKHQVWVKDKKGAYTLADLPKDATVRFVLGEVTKSSGREKKIETWFFADHKGNLVEKLDHPDLHAKTVLFIKVIP